VAGSTSLPPDLTVAPLSADFRVPSVAAFARAVPFLPAARFCNCAEPAVPAAPAAGATPKRGLLMANTIRHRKEKNASRNARRPELGRL